MLTNLPPKPPLAFFTNLVASFTIQIIAPLIITPFQQIQSLKLGSSESGFRDGKKPQTMKCITFITDNVLNFKLIAIVDVF